MPINSKPSAIRDALAAAGARFAVHRGNEVPDEFSGVDDEYRAACEAAVVGDRSYRAHLRVTGNDRVSFLQNMLTNDLKSLEPGDGLHAALLTRLGKLVSDLFVYQLDDAILLEMEPGALTPVTEALSHYIISEDVDLRDTSDDEARLSLQGPRSSELLSQVLDQGLTELAPFHFLQTTLAGRKARVSATPHGPGQSFDIAVAPKDTAWLLNKLLAAGDPLGLRPAGWQALEIRRIEAGIPLFGVDMDESHFPLEAGLDEAISFTKGCYLGQEYVVRLAHRGHLNRKLVGIQVSDSRVPRSGDAIFESPSDAGQNGQVGQVTSGAFSASLGRPIALGYVKRNSFAPGTPLSIHIEDQVFSAQVTDLPFVGSP